MRRPRIARTTLPTRNVSSEAQAVLLTQVKPGHIYDVRRRAVKVERVRGIMILRGAAMIFRVTTTGIQIIPETPQDIAYIEHVLGLQNDSHSTGLFRVVAHDDLRLIHLETDTLGQGCFLCGNPMRGMETGAHQHCSAYEQPASDNLVRFTAAARGGNR